jgi:hypothetical protein
MRAVIAISLVLVATVPVAVAALPASLQSVLVDGTEFKVMLADGRVLRSRDLVGATLMMQIGPRALRVRIDAVEHDPDARLGDVWLHTISAQAPDGSWRNICQAGPDGRRQGFPLAGRVRLGDTVLDAAEVGVFDITCTSGARGKCVRWGYLPWVEGGLDRYNACVRMARADYCGDGRGTTRDGMSIDMYDDRGIQEPDNDPTHDFEAGWTSSGAVCVRHVRVKENVALAALAEMCPRLKDRLGEMCTEDKARALRAWLFNRSRP